MKTLHDLLLALLNATILLLIVLLIVATLFVSRVSALREGIVSSVVATLAPTTEGVERIGDQLEQINAQLQTADGENIEALRVEIAAMRDRLPDMSLLEEIGPAQIAKQIVIAIGEQLSQEDVR